MDDSALSERCRRGLWTFYRLLADASGDSRLLELEGVAAAIVPAAPGRSVANGVVYRDPASLAGALEVLASTYDRAGVVAWTVWVPGSDAETAHLLEQAGHRLDATPVAMGFELKDFEPASGPGIRIERTGNIGVVAELNDRAYGYAESRFSDALRTTPEGLHMYVAYGDGDPCACTVALDDGDDCGIYFVATLPEARGQGLARALMTRALTEGRERGCATTTLQATKMGYSLYTSLGYRDLGVLQMWERRRPGAG